MIDTLKVSNVTFSYDKENVIEDLGFGLKGGDVLCIKGKNGSGKTTLFKLLAGILKAGQMDVTYNGKNISNDELKKRVFFIPSAPYLYDELSGNENLELLRNLWRKDKKEYYEKVGNYLNRYEMTDHSNSFVANYSLGMKYKLYFSAALAIEPDIIMMDEPLNAMDLESQAKAIQDVMDYVKGNEKAVMFSSHISQLINNLSNRILLLKDGRLIGE